MPGMRAAGGSGDLRNLMARGRSGSLSDGQLLERFVRERDEGGDMAFASLMDRHGPMVLRVCRGLLRDANDAEDAFQATFLVLAKRAGSLWVRDSIGPWLHGVAYRVATRSASDRARRARHEQKAASRAVNVMAPAEVDDLDRLLHAEVERLPERFRSPIVLCYLQGLTHDEAASQLGWPVGTVRSRLSRGRDKLRGRLDHLGLAGAIEAVAPDRGGSHRANEPIPPSLAVATVRLALGGVCGNLTAVGVVPAVATLTKGAIRTMILDRIFKLGVGALAAGILATGATVALQSSGTGKAYARSEAPAKSEAETIAESFLKAGADLFNARNAAALAETYTADGTIRLVSHRDGVYREDLKQGRAEVETFYAECFKTDRQIDPKNTVEFVRQIRPDLIVVNGRFRVISGEPELPFVQLRTKQGDKWLLSQLWLFLDPK